MPYSLEDSLSLSEAKELSWDGEEDTDAMLLSFEIIFGAGLLANLVVKGDFDFVEMISGWDNSNLFNGPQPLDCLALMLVSTQTKERFYA